MTSKHVFRYKNRDWTLYRRGTGTRQAAPGTPWSYRLTVGGKRVLISTRTAHLETALRTAKARIDAVMSGRVDALTVDRAQTGRGKIPTLDQVEEVYLGAQLVRDRTANTNITALNRLVRAVTGQQNVGSMKIDVLSGELASTWLAKRQGLPKPDYGTVRPANVGANSALRQAQAVFAARHRHIWKDWRLPPGVTAFREAKPLKEAGARYVPIPEDLLAKMDAAAERLRKEPGPLRETRKRAVVKKRRTREDNDEPPKRWDGLELWIVNRSIRLMGLRDSEVQAMKTGWLTEHGGRLYLEIVARPGEFVPKGHQGRVLVPSVLEPIFRQRLAEADGESVPLVRATSETARHDLIYRVHSKWLRPFLPKGRRKTNHELRKHAGSLVALKFNSWEAAARFLREDLVTAKNHYLELLQPVGLEVEDLTYDAGPRKRQTPTPSSRTR